MPRFLKVTFSTFAENRPGGRVMLPMRYLMAIMGSIGMAIIYGFKVNVSVAIVAMVNHTAVRLMSNETTNLTEQTVPVGENYFEKNCNFFNDMSLNV